MIGEKNQFGVVQVSGKDYVLWTHVRKGRWLIGLSDILHVWQSTFVLEQKWREG
jgi:hypothetical protein